MKQYSQIVLDNGHGSNTAGKRSPDGRFLEWKWNREVVDLILSYASNDETISQFSKLVPEEEDIALDWRTNKFDNRIKRSELFPSDTTLLLSIHSNAAGMGDKWYNAKGFGVFYDRKHAHEVEPVAQMFAHVIEKTIEAGEETNYKLKKWGEGIIPTENKYSIIAFPKCNSLLLELGFYDNQEEVEYLLSLEGKREIAFAVYTACRKALGYNIWLDKEA